jgi:hypothetical protein
MRIRLTNGIWIGIVAGIFRNSLTYGMLAATIIEVMSVAMINIFWVFNGYKDLKPGSFMASLILPNTSPYEKDFAYQEILMRIYLRSVTLICMILWPAFWLFFLIIFTLTLLYK